MKPDCKTAAICGLFCGVCPCYPEECHGCLSDKLTAHCAHCPNGFRSCAEEHHVVRCYECTEFPCARLTKFRTRHWENGICHHAAVIDDLAAMKTHGAEAWVQTKTAENTCPNCGKLIAWMDKNTHQCSK